MLLLRLKYNETIGIPRNARTIRVIKAGPHEVIVAIETKTPRHLVPADG